MTGKSLYLRRLSRVISRPAVSSQADAMLR